MAKALVMLYLVVVFSNWGQALAQGECGKTDLVIILDASTSVGPDNFEKMLQFCKDFLANVDIDSGNVQAGILTYSTGVKIEFQIGAHKTSTDLQKAIDGIKYSYGSTNTANAILTMATKMFGTSADRNDAPNIAIVLTDGVSNINSRRTIPEAESARKNNIHIYSIGIGLTDTKEVFAIATPPHEENSFNVRSFDQLRGLAQKILPSICPVVIPTTETTETTRRPTTAGCPAARLDLVFILDSSTSVGQDNYNKILKFCKDVIQNADIDSGIVRVGIVSYSTAVNVEFYLNSYSTKTDIFHAINIMSFRNGSRNIADALRITRTKLYAATNGNRNWVRDVAIILTSGAPDINSERTIPEAEQARADGIHIYAVGIGLQDTVELDAIASPPKELNSFNLQDFDELTVLSRCTSNHDDLS